jgi:hypothetical protein
MASWICLLTAFGVGRSTHVHERGIRPELQHWSAINGHGTHRHPPLRTAKLLPVTQYFRRMGFQAHGISGAWSFQRRCVDAKQRLVPPRNCFPKGQLRATNRSVVSSFRARIGPDTYPSSLGEFGSWRSGCSGRFAVRTWPPMPWLGHGLPSRPVAADAVPNG